MSHPRFLFLNLGHLYDHLAMLLFPAAAVIMVHEFDASYGDLIALASAGFLAFGAGALPSGWLGDRWSRPAMMAVFFIGLGAAVVLTGLADSRLSITIGLFFIGLFGSIYHPIGIAMVAAGGGEKIGQRLGINGVWGNMGVALSPLAAIWLAESFGWRMVFFIPGAIIFATGLAWLWHCRNSAETAAAAARSNAKAALHVDNWKQLLVVLAVLTSLGGFIFSATTVSMPKIFEERVVDFAGSLANASLYATFVYMIASLTQVVVGQAIDRYAIKPILLIVMAGQALTLFLAVNADGAMMVIAGLLMMALIFGQIPIIDTLIGRTVPDHMRSRVFAVKYVLNFSVAAMAPIAIAAMHDSGGGFVTLFLVLSTIAAIITVCALGLPQIIKSSSAAAAASSVSG